MIYHCLVVATNSSGLPDGRICNGSHGGAIGEDGRAYFIWPNEQENEALIEASQWNTFGGKTDYQIWSFDV